MKRPHIPVLVKEVLVLLNIKSGDKIIDATLDGGGHTEAMLNIILPAGKVLGIEQDEKMIKTLEKNILESGEEFWKNLIIANGNFRNIDAIAVEHNFKNIDAILFDLGMSTWHIKESRRGFSFQELNEPILMNLGNLSEKNAARIINSSTKEELKTIFIKYGELRAPYATKIAEKILIARKNNPILTVNHFLAATGVKDKKMLARIFQALRIQVNDELNAIEEALEKSFKIIRPNGRIAVISYHSLEDRIIKNFFKLKFQNNEASIVTKKPVIASREEIIKNTSARSAKLRVIKKI